MGGTLQSSTYTVFMQNVHDFRGRSNTIFTCVRATPPTVTLMHMVACLLQLYVLLHIMSCGIERLQKSLLDLVLIAAAHDPEPRAGHERRGIACPLVVLWRTEACSIDGAIVLSGSC